MGEITTYRQNAFNAGELSPRLKGRSDLDKYATGLETCTNALILPGGALVKRPGFRYINDTKDSTKWAALIGFEYSESQAYALEFGDLYMRVYMDGGRVTTADADTVLLLHFDGIDRDITITDNGVDEHDVACYGNAALDTDQYVFPTASCLFDGNGDYISIDDHADWDFGADEFTIDFRVRFYANSGISTIWLQQDAANQDRIWFFVDHERGKICLQVVDGEAVIVNEAGDWTPSVDTWYHVALIRGWGAVANDWAICVDGTAIHTFTDAGVMPNHDQAVTIGGGLATTDIFDFSDQAHTLTVGGAVALSATQAKFGDKSISYSGAAGNYISAVDHADWDVCSTDNAETLLAAWVYRPAAAAGTQRAIFGQYVDGGNFWSLEVTAANKMKFAIATAGSYRINATSEGTVSTDTWHYVVMQKTATNYYAVFLDGVQVVYGRYDVDVKLAAVLRIGGGNAAWLGYAEDFVVEFDNPESVDSGKPYLDEGNTGHGYATQCVAAGEGSPSSTYKWGDGGLYFDGTDDGVRFNDHADWDICNQANFTVDLWVKHTDHAGSEVYLSHGASGDDCWWCGNVHGTGLRFQLYVGAVLKVNVTGTEIADTSWHHVAFVKVGTDWGIYLDGVQVAYTSDADTAAEAGAPYLYIGRYVSGSYFDGNMDEIRITHANSFGAAPVVGLTDTITVPTAAHTSDANTKLLMHCDQDSVAVPTAPFEPTSNTKLFVRADATHLYGWLDEFRVSTTNRWTTTFSKPTQEYPAGGGGTTYELVTPYSYVDVFDIKVAQSADVLYLFHPDYPTQKLSRTDHDNWTITEVDWAEPPWNEMNTTATTLDPSDVTGAIDVVASAPFFTQNHVGAYFKQANGYYQITAVTDSENAEATVKDDLDNHNATANWYQGAWDATQGYPACGVFHEDRLVVIEYTHPLTVFLSGVGDYENFGALTSPVVDTDPCQFDVMARTQNQLRWLEAGKKLFMGTYGAEFWMTGETIDLPITPTSVLVRRETTFGGEAISPVTVGHQIFFVQKGAKRLVEWGYSNDDDAYVGADLTVLAEHFTKDATIEKIQYAQDPFGIVWAQLSNGYLLGMTYLRDHKVLGFHIHDTGLDGIIESIAVIPGTYGDELWAIICREVDGTDCRFVEKMEKDFFGGDLETDPFFLDCALSYLGAPASSFTGMDHLEGEDVGVFADGVYVGTKTISGGSFTLDTAASYVVAGLLYNTNIKTLTPDVAQREGSDACMWKRIFNITYQVYETCNFTHGSDSSNLLSAELEEDELNSGEFMVPFNGGFELYPSIYIRQGEPVPFTLLSIAYQLEGINEKSEDVFGGGE